MKKTDLQKDGPGKPELATISKRVTTGKRNDGSVKKFKNSHNKANSDAHEPEVAYKWRASIAKVASSSGYVSFADTDEFFELREAAGFSSGELASLIGTTDRTIRTKRQKGETFDISQTERLRKLIQLYHEGAIVLGSKESFNEWLRKPAYALDNAVPADILKQPGGVDVVIREIIAIKYGDTV